MQRIVKVGILIRVEMSSKHSINKRLEREAYKIVFLIVDCVSNHHLGIQPRMLRHMAGKSPVIVVRPIHHRGHTALQAHVLIVNVS